MKTTNPSLVTLTRLSPLGKPRAAIFPSNSGAVKRDELKRRERVLHSGGTRIGKFEKE